jgi:putative tryptophan/tyrosine transport system substrate-binding protein
MRRREFIGLLGGAAATWPHAARAQQSPMSIVGFLSGRSLDTDQELIGFIREGLLEGGYTEGRNAVFEYRGAEGKYDRLPELARDLVRRQATVIITMGGGLAALAAKGATSSIPIVFTSGGDPVAIGLVPSLNRPGGNVTGVVSLLRELARKRLGLLLELAPKASTIAVLVNPTTETGSAEAPFFTPLRSTS